MLVGCFGVPGAIFLVVFEALYTLARLYLRNCCSILSAMACTIQNNRCKPGSSSALFFLACQPATIALFVFLNYNIAFIMIARAYSSADLQMSTEPDSADLASLEDRIKRALGAVQAARAKSTSPFDVRSIGSDSTPEPESQQAHPLVRACHNDCSPSCGFVSSLSPPGLNSQSYPIISHVLIYCI